MRVRVSHSLLTLSFLVLSGLAARAQTAAVEAIHFFPGYTDQGERLSPSRLIEGADGLIYGITNTKFYRMTTAGEVTVLYTFPQRR